MVKAIAYPDAGRMVKPKGQVDMPDLTGLMPAVRNAAYAPLGREDAEAGDGLEQMAKAARPGPDGIPRLPLGIVRTPYGPIKVFAVPGHVINTMPGGSMNMVCGENPLHAKEMAKGGRVYIPDDEIWVDSDLHAERWFDTLLHEFAEYFLMKKGMKYEQAHELSNSAEFGAMTGQLPVPADGQQQPMGMGMAGGGMMNQQPGQGLVLGMMPESHQPMRLPMN